MSVETEEERAARTADNHGWFLALSKLPEAAGRLSQEKELLSGQEEAQ